MNDDERFSKQMNQTFDLLQRAISELDLPLLQRDKLSGLVRDLREFSYQTGRTEVGSRRSDPSQNPLV